MQEEKLHNGISDQGETREGLSLSAHPLSAEEVSSRREKGLVNGTMTVPTKSVREILITNLLTPFHALNIALAAAIVLFGDIKNALFMVVVIINAAVGIFQELRAKKKIDSLSLISAPRATVLRRGASSPDDAGFAAPDDSASETEIPSSELVLDDIMRLSQGFQVCADAIVTEGECQVDESLLTGEADPVTKRPGDMLYSGSFIVSGRCHAVVTHVGMDNYAAKISQRAKYLKKPASEIMKAVNRIIKAVAFAIIPIGAALFCRQYFAGGVELSAAVTSTVAALVGMIPEGLVLLTSVVLAVGIIRLARHNALVQELYSIEMLARVDTLCLDKTGTLTEGRMTVESADAEALEVAAYICRELGEENPTAAAIRAASEPSAVCASSSEKNSAAQKDLALEKKDSEGWDGASSPLITRRVAFSSARKWSGVQLSDGSILVMGAAQFVLAGRWDLFSGIEARIKEAASRGLRTILVVRSSSSFEEYADHAPDARVSGIATISSQSGEFIHERADASAEPALPADLEIVGLIVLSDVIRASAPETIAYFTEQGVDIKIISGDDPETVSQIARRCSVPGAERCVDMSAQPMSKAADYTVFGRVTPEQKLQLVKELKAEGHVVAMMGDGVNDVMALKESDCSVAPAAGSDAARNVSQIVLLDSDFASLPRIVAEGRRSINNLQRSASLFLTKTIFAAITAVLFIFLSFRYPLEPIHMTLIAGLTIGAPSFVLALQPNRERVKGHFLSNVLTKAFPGALADVIAVVIASILLTGRYEPHIVSAVSAMLMALIGFMVLFKVCVPFDGLRIALFTVMLGAYVAVLFIMPGFFSLVHPNWQLLQAFLPLAVIAAGVYLLLILVWNKVEKKIIK